MPSRMMRPIPKGSIRIASIGQRQWTFEYPRLTEQVYDRFYEALELRSMGELKAATNQLLDLLVEYPEFIDAHHHVALMDEAQEKWGDAFHRWKIICMSGFDELPDGFCMGRDELSWLILDNRPFLRTLHALGLAYRARAEYRTAISFFVDLLDLDAGDHQGARAIAVELYLHLRRPLDVLSVCARFPEDVLPDTLYGRVLAWLQLGHEDQAAEALEHAFDVLPRVARELRKKSHRRPDNIRPDRVTVGGTDEAYLYWSEVGHHWRNTPGAIEFVRAFVAAKLGRR